MSLNEALVSNPCVTDMGSIHSGFTDSLDGAERGPTKFECVSLKPCETRKQRKQKLEKKCKPKHDAKRNISSQHLGM